MKRLLALLSNLTNRLNNAADKLSGEMGESNHATDAETFILPARKRGRRILYWIVGLTIVWALFAPLDSASVAMGKVVLDANKKTVQHLEGGLIEEIFVRDGMKVEKGQPLIRLNETSVRANRDISYNQLFTAKASEERLKAELEGKDTLVFSESLTALEEEPRVKEIMETQQELFASRRATQRSKTDIMNQRIKQLREETEGLRAQRSAASRQISLLGDEIGSVETLVQQHNAPRSRLLALQRQQADLEGRRGDYQARMARADQSVAENELAILNMRNEFIENVTEELRKVQADLAGSQEKFAAYDDVLSRIVIAAPQSGIVTGMRFHTVGGVIPPGETVMEIVPQDDRLVIEAQIQPIDIDVVHAGLEAEVRLSAFRARYMPNLKGKVMYVSPDAITEQHTNRTYYITRVSVDAAEFQQLSQHVELYPGMPAEVIIKTGERTFAGYLFDPLVHSFRRAFREE